MNKIMPTAAKFLASNVVVSTTSLVKAAPIIISRSNSKKSEAILETKPYKLFKLDKGPSQTCVVKAEEALDLYEKMLRIRRMENTVAKLYKDKLITGFCHLYSGQEAVAVGIKSALRKMDTAVTSYRCHAWTLMFGASMASILCELTGRRSGVSRGKGGSMHMYTKNFYGGNGIVGAQVPVGTGIALAHKYRGDGGVCFVLYGDGAANQGQLFEAFNIAKLMCLPCVFLCENNTYGMGTSVSRSSANTQCYTRGDYIPGVWVDGMDVVACREAAKFAIDHCTSGKGPIVVEMETYRYTGHSMSDPGTSYRSRDEIKLVRQNRDPITNFKEKILKHQLVTEAQLKEIDVKIKKEVDDAEKLAKSDAVPGVEELAGDIYYKNLHEYIRGVQPGAPLKHSEVAPRKAFKPTDVAPLKIV